MLLENLRTKSRYYFIVAQLLKIEKAIDDFSGLIVDDIVNQFSRNVGHTF